MTGPGLVDRVAVGPRESADPVWERPLRSVAHLGLVESDGERHALVAEDPGTVGAFHEGADELARLDVDAVVAAVDLGDARSAVDVGGTGALMSALLRDVFEGGLPGGRDRYPLEHVLEGYDDEAVTAIPRHCREAMLFDSVLTIVERVLPDPSPVVRESVVPLFGDLRAPTGHGGKSRIEAEFSELLDAAGLRPASDHQADHSGNVVTARVR